jgi:hypothetical protein
MTKVGPPKKGRKTLSCKKQVTKHQDRVPKPAVENAELGVDEDVLMETPAEHSGQSQRLLRSSASPMTKVGPPKKGRKTLSCKKQVTKHQDHVPEPAVENAELDIDENILMETPAEHSGQSQRLLRSSASPMTKVGPLRKGRKTLSRKKQVTKHQDHVPEPAVENTELDIDEDILMEMPAEAVQVGRNTRAALAELAQEYSKTIHYMMIQADLGVWPSRPPNPFNMFKSWFVNEYRNECTNNVAATKCMYLFTKQYMSH